jgi:hypothetical protein
MSQRNSPFAAFETPLTDQRAAGWDLMECDKPPRLFKRHSPPHLVYAPDWENAVPNLIEKLASQISEKKKLEIRFNLLEILTNELQARIYKLENAQTKIIPINTFAPEPYELLKPILVSVQSVGDEFEAGWFDANIHSAGDNEEEAVTNLKSLILDYFDSFSKEPNEKLGIEPKRQFAVIKTFIPKKA